MCSQQWKHFSTDFFDRRILYSATNERNVCISFIEHGMVFVHSHFFLQFSKVVWTIDTAIIVANCKTSRLDIPCHNSNDAGSDDSLWPISDLQCFWRHIWYRLGLLGTSAEVLSTVENPYNASRVESTCTVPCSGKAPLASKTCVTQRSRVHVSLV